MNKRLEEIYSAIDSCKIFADIGCDHGLISQAMLCRGKCEKVIISDVSKKCLEKAELLLAEDIKTGRVISVVSDGFDELPEVDLALIAGMGGQEISQILSKANNLPQKLVLQPMKNSEKVRATAIKLGYKVVKDYVFKCDKIYYDLIILTKGEDFLTEEEIEFGRTNLSVKGQDFKEKINKKIAKISGFLNNKNLNEQTKVKMTEEIERLKKYV